MKLVFCDLYEHTATNEHYLLGKLHNKHTESLVSWNIVRRRNVETDDAHHK